MAKLNSPLDFTGSIGNLTFYKHKSSTQTIVREKSTLAPKRIKNDPCFKRTRQMAGEWDGCVTAFKWVHRIVQPLDATADYNFSGTLQGLFKPVQKGDSEGVYGQRSVRLSRYLHLLEGFTLSRQTPFDTLLRTLLPCSIEKEALSAWVMIPEIIHGLNFFPRTTHPYFRVVASLGVVPDVHYSSSGYMPDLTPGSNLPQVVMTEWTGVKKGMSGERLELQLPYSAAWPTYSLVLAVAISFGTLDVLGNVQAVKHTGSGRIMKVI
jgi:hypothetical protein